MWEHFETDHQKILERVVNQAKGTICMNEDDIKTKMHTVLDNMRNEFANYKLMVAKHLGAIMCSELKRLIDQRMVELGLEGDDQSEELLEPKSNFDAMTKKFDEFQL